MPQPRKVVTSSNLAARAVARQSRLRPWAQSQAQPSRIRNRPALQPEMPPTPEVEQIPEVEQTPEVDPEAQPAKPKANGRRVHWDDTANTIHIIPARSMIPVFKSVSQNVNSAGPSTGRTSQRQPGTRQSALPIRVTTTLKRPAAQPSYVTPAKDDGISVRIIHSSVH